MYTRQGGSESARLQTTIAGVVEVLVGALSPVWLVPTFLLRCSACEVALGGYLVCVLIENISPERKFKCKHSVNGKYTATREVFSLHAGILWEAFPFMRPVWLRLSMH